MTFPLQLDEIRTELKNAKLGAERLITEMSETQLWQRPSDGGWSVGECLVHLCLVGEPYLPKLRDAAREARAKRLTGQGPFKFGFLGERFVRSQAVGGAPVGTSKIFEPKPEPGVLTRFVGLQDALLILSEEADGLELSRTTFRTPNLPLRLSLFEALNLLVVHQQRHFAQAERVRVAITQKASA